MKIVIIVQARLTSTRFPRKMLTPIGGESSLVLRVLKNVSSSKLADSVVLATSSNPTDRELYEHVIEHGYKCFRGDLDDVLQRFYDAASYEQADVVVRVTGDCPCITGDWIDYAIDYFTKAQKESKIDYLGYPGNMPDGLDVEVFTFSALKKAHEEATLPSDREHVTPFIWRHPEIFKQEKLSVINDNYSIIRLCVDTKEDYEFIKAFLANNCYKTYKQLFELIDSNRSMLIKHSQKFVKNEGFYKSLNNVEGKIPLLALGLASIGQSYGWRTSEVHKDYSKYYDLLFSAYNSGLNYWDTAPAYGDSEKIIGSFVRETGLKPNILTKVTIDKHILNSDSDKIYNYIKTSLLTSIDNIGLKPYCLQIHNADSNILSSQKLFDCLRRLLGDFKIPELGVAVYGENLEEAYNNKMISLIQFEYNLARTKHLKNFLHRYEKNKKKLIVRSVFNKGLFTATTLEQIGSQFSIVLQAFKELRNIAKEYRTTLKELALRYVLSIPEIDIILLGMGNSFEVINNIEIYKKGKLPFEIKQRIDELKLDQYWEILDPRRW